MDGEIRVMLSRNGLKETRSRLSILSILHEVDKPVSADEIYKLVKDKYDDIAYATLYRNLKLLCENNLVNKCVLSDGIGRYDLEKGVYLLCQKCGRYISIDAKKIIDHDFKVSLIYGLCSNCKSSTE